MKDNIKRLFHIKIKRSDIINYQEAKSDVYEYLNAKDDDYFAERGRTKTDVLNDEDLIEEIAAEHYHCVNSFGNEREWSCADACDREPGFYREEESLDFDGYVARKVDI